MKPVTPILPFLMYNFYFSKWFRGYKVLGKTNVYKNSNTVRFPTGPMSFMHSHH